MRSYVLRRLLMMIPTLFGITIVSFLVMQLSPGDPLLAKHSATGGQSTGTRHAYLLQKKELKLDKPLLLNARYLFNYEDEARIGAGVLQMSKTSLADLLTVIGDTPEDELTEQQTVQLKLFRSLRVSAKLNAGIPQFEELLHPLGLPTGQIKRSELTQEEWALRVRERRESLAAAVRDFTEVWMADRYLHLTPQMIALLTAEDTSCELKIGAIQALHVMVENPFTYTFSREPTLAQEREVVATWQRLWPIAADKFGEVAPDRATRTRAIISQIAERTRAAMIGSNDKETQAAAKIAMFDTIENEFSYEDAPVMYATLIGDYPLYEKVIAAEFLKLHEIGGGKLETDVPRDASAEKIAQAAANWRLYYQVHRDTYEPSVPMRLVYLLTDTQYGHMVWRLVSFQFGKTAVEPREPVAQKIGRAIFVSVPLMVMAQLIIYLIAIPSGVVCAVSHHRQGGGARSGEASQTPQSFLRRHISSLYETLSVVLWRRGALDRNLSLILFFLYSIPPFVAAMLLLLGFCYGGRLAIFPMGGLHSDNADSMGYVAYTLDYIWHAFLPVMCLSLFSLAGLAMYSRSAMLDVLTQDFIRTARSKGISNYQVIVKHALPNSLIPIVTLFAGFLPAMLGGSVLIEVIFNIPGMGRLGFSAIEQKDYPTLMALIYIDAIVVMLSILMTDLLYVVIDPRISFGKEGTAS